MSDALFCEKTLADLPGLMASIGKRARMAARVLATTGRAEKDRALQEAAAALRRDMAFLLQENARDMDAGREKGLSAAMLDRLELTPGRIEAMARGLEDVAALPDPVGRVMAAWERPNGLKLERVSTPLGVVGVIYESRPNVTADAGALCLKAGNAVILRGGSESFHSSRAIAARLMEGLQAAGLPADAIQMVPTADREAVGIMLSMSDDIDVIVPRGGRGLIERITADSRIPLFKHLEGVCHTYVHSDADPGKARSIILNAKMRRTGICGATETILIDRAVAEPLLPSLIHDLRAAGCEVRGDELVEVIDPDVVPATDEDWGTEYLDAIVAIRVVEGIDEAISHIARYSSSHTEAIITENPEAAERFLNEVDSAIVMHNASTQFADGGEFGMGAEIGISTGRLHARGPVGVEQLTIFKYKVRGSGQVRP